MCKSSACSKDDETMQTNAEFARNSTANICLMLDSWILSDLI